MRNVYGKYELGAAFRTDGSQKNVRVSVMMKPQRGRINLSYVNNPQLEDLLDKQRGEFDNAARKKIIMQIEDVVAEQQYEIYWSTDTRTYFWDPTVENYRPSAFFPYTHVMKGWFNK